MTWLAGIFRTDGEPVEEDCVFRMLRSIPGPVQRASFWRAGNVALGVGLGETESVVPREAVLPADETFCIADARLDNRSELLRELGFRQETARTEPAGDAEIVAASYRQLGTGAFSRFVGDFAFVLWDGKRRRMLAVRDCVGMRPLFWARSGPAILLASSIGQLRSTGLVGSELDGDTVEDWLLLGARRDPAATFFSDIRQVPAGSFLVADRRGVTIRSYWEWSEREETRHRSLRECAEDFRAVFDRAVSDRIRGDRPVGLMLSGGLDSAAVAASVTELLGRDAARRRLRAYSFVYEKFRGCDERQYLEPLCGKLGIGTTYLRPEEFAPFQEGYRADEPDGLGCYDPSWLEALARLRDAGGSTMLTGSGGETLLLSQSHLHFFDWARERRWSLLARELAAHKKLHGRWPRRIWRAVLVRSLPQAVYEVLPRFPWAPDDPPWLRSGPKRRRRRTERWRAARSPRVFRSFAKQVAFEALVGSPEARTMWTGEQEMARRVGVTYAHPFLDRRLVEFVFSLPLERFFRHGENRVLLREAFGCSWPEELRRRHRDTLFDEWFAGRPSDAELWHTVRDLWTERAEAWVPRPDAPPPPEVFRRRRNQLLWLAIFLYWLRFSVE